MKITAFKQILFSYLLYSNTKDIYEISLEKQSKNTITISVTKEMKENALKSIGKLKFFKDIFKEINQKINQIYCGNNDSNNNSAKKKHEESSNSIVKLQELEEYHLNSFSIAITEINRFHFDEETEVTIGYNNELDDLIYLLISIFNQSKLLNYLQTKLEVWLDSVKSEFDGFINSCIRIQESLKEKNNDSKSSFDVTNENDRTKSEGVHLL